MSGRARVQESTSTARWRRSRAKFTITSLAMTDGCVYSAWRRVVALPVHSFLMRGGAASGTDSGARSVTRSLGRCRAVLYGGTCDPRQPLQGDGGAPGQRHQEWGFPQVSFERLAVRCPAKGSSAWWPLATASASSG